MMSFFRKRLLGSQQTYNKTYAAPSKEYEISSLDDFHHLSVPRFNYTGIAFYSPNKRYIASGNNRMLALVDTKNNHLMFVYDIFCNIDSPTLLITDHPYIAVRDKIALGQNRRNDIYLLNHRYDILFKESINAHVYKMTVSNNAKYIAFQQANCEICLYDIESSTLIASWKPPKVLAVSLIIDIENSAVMLVDFKGNVFRYTFSIT